MKLLFILILFVLTFYSCSSETTKDTPYIIKQIQPKSDLEIEAIVKKSISKKLNSNFIEIVLENHFSKDLGIDQIDFIDILIEVEKLLHTSVVDSIAEKISTVKELIHACKFAYNNNIVLYKDENFNNTAYVLTENDTLFSAKHSHFKSGFNSISIPKHFEVNIALNNIPHETILTFLTSKDRIEIESMKKADKYWSGSFKRISAIRKN